MNASASPTASRDARAGLTFEANPAFPDCTHGQGERLSLPAPGLRRGRAALIPARSRCRRSGQEDQEIVNQRVVEIIRDAEQGVQGHRGDDTDYYPIALRGEIDRINDFVYTRINNGVYRCGFARSQQRMTRRTTHCSGRSTSSSPPWRNRFWSATRRPGRLAPLSGRWCASTWRTFRSSAAIASASPTFRT